MKKSLLLFAAFSYFLGAYSQKPEDWIPNKPDLVFKTNFSDIAKKIDFKNTKQNVITILADVGLTTLFREALDLDPNTLPTLFYNSNQFGVDDKEDLLFAISSNDSAAYIGLYGQLKNVDVFETYVRKAILHESSDHKIYEEGNVKYAMVYNCYIVWNQDMFTLMGTKIALQYRQDHDLIYNRYSDYGYYGRHNEYEYATEEAAVAEATAEEVYKYSVDDNLLESTYEDFYNYWDAQGYNSKKEAFINYMEANGYNISIERAKCLYNISNDISEYDSSLNQIRNKLTIVIEGTSADTDDEESIETTEEGIVDDKIDGEEDEKEDPFTKSKEIERQWTLEYIKNTINNNQSTLASNKLILKNLAKNHDLAYYYNTNFSKFMNRGFNGVFMDELYRELDQTSLKLLSAVDSIHPLFRDLNRFVYLDFDQDKVTVESKDIYSDEAKPIMKELYNQKVDKRLFKYLENKNHFGIASLNFNTKEAQTVLREIVQNTAFSMGWEKQLERNRDVLDKITTYMNCFEGNFVISSNDFINLKYTYTNYDYKYVDGEYQSVESQEEIETLVPKFTLAATIDKGNEGQLIKMLESTATNKGSYYALDVFGSSGTPIFFAFVNDILIITNNPDLVQNKLKDGFDAKERLSGPALKIAQKNTASIYINTDNTFNILPLCFDRYTKYAAIPMGYMSSFIDGVEVETNIKGNVSTSKSVIYLKPETNLSFKNFIGTYSQYFSSFMFYGMRYMF